MIKQKLTKVAVKKINLKSHVINIKTTFKKKN